MKIEIKDWKPFLLKDLYNIKLGNKFDKDKMSTENPTVNFVSRISYNNGIIRKTKCFRIWERNAIISKTKRNFSRLYPTPQNFKKIDRLRRNEIHLKAVRTPS